MEKKELSGCVNVNAEKKWLLWVRILEEDIQSPVGVSIRSGHLK